MYRIFAAWLTIGSIASVRKSPYISSTTTRVPSLPRRRDADDRLLGDRRVAHPVRTELVQQAGGHAEHAAAVPHTAMSSPMQNTDASRAISSRSAAFSASVYVQLRHQA